MECIKCKKEIPDGAPFCCWCGKKQQTKRATKRGNGTGSEKICFKFFSHFSIKVYIFH